MESRNSLLVGIIFKEIAKIPNVTNGMFLYAYSGRKEIVLQEKIVYSFTEILAQWVHQLRKVVVLRKEERVGQRNRKDDLRKEEKQE